MLMEDLHAVLIGVIWGFGNERAWFLAHRLLHLCMALNQATTGMTTSRVVGEMLSGDCGRTMVQTLQKRSVSAKQ